MSEESLTQLIITDIPYKFDKMVDELLLKMYDPDPFNLVQRDPITGMASVEFIGNIITEDQAQKFAFKSWIALSASVRKYKEHVKIIKEE